MAASQTDIDATIADATFQEALNAGDAVALAREIRRRLDSCTHGTGISFRTGWRQKSVWRGTTAGEGAPEHIKWSREAARALIADAKSKGDVK